MAKKTKNSQKTPENAPAIHVICQNRRAKFDYALEDQFEAGLVLTGSEVKSLRQGRANLSDAYGDLRGGEVFLLQAQIEPYDKGGYANHEAKRPRKLLLHRDEIKKIIGKVQTKGYTLVPMRLYFKNGRAKLAMALGTGKKQIDKRQTIKERLVGREMDRALKNKR